MSKPYIFYIDGMTCISCSGVIENHLRKNKSYDLEYFHVDLTAPDPKKTTVLFKEHKEEHQSSWLRLKDEIEDVGFECRPYEYTPEQTPSAPVKQTENTWLSVSKKIITSHWFLGAVGCILGLALLIAFLVAGGLPLAAMIAIGSLSTLLTLALGARSYSDAWKKLFRSKTLTMDTLFSISTLTVLAVSIASFFVPWLPMMFEAGLLIYGFRHIGLAIEETLKGKIRSAQFQDRAPKTARLWLESGVYDLPLTAITPNTIISINPGELIPLDGVCQEHGLIYSTIINGSPLPRHYRQGEKVFAGMRLAEDSKPLTIKVTHKAQDSYLARLDKNIAQSNHEKAPLEVKTQKLLSYFIPAVLGFAVLSGILMGLFFPAAVAIQCAVSILVSACPCTLGLIIPLAVKTGMHKATEIGVHFKNAKALQEIEQAKMVLFDLNGTLTTGIPEVTQYGIAPKSSGHPDELLSVCAALEEGVTHPIGKAIYSFANKHKSGTKKISTLNTSHHAGISGLINEQEYTIGGWGLMHEKGIITKELDQQLTVEAGDTVVYIAKDQELLGYVIMTDPVREDARQTVNTLKGMGIEVGVCTGADEQTAGRCAQLLGINQVYANCLATSLKPGDKSKPSVIRELQRTQKKKIVMVGDAANDALALAASDFGIAILSANADELTQQHAGAVIYDSKLMPIANAFAVSKQTVQNINQNLIMSLGYNLSSLLISSGLFIGLGMTISPAIGAALMAIQACIILLNVYRFKQKKLSHSEKESTDRLSSDSFSLIQQKTSALQTGLNTSPSQSKSEEKPVFFANPFKPPSPACKKEEHKPVQQIIP